jgi:hypothetical protein
VSLETAFAKLVGRDPSEEQRERLYRIRDALGLKDNDAFWSIVMALEHYDSFFRQYPAELAEHTANCIESARAAFAVAAQNEAAHVERLLAERVAETSVEIARKLAERPVGLHRVTMLLASVVAFGAMCVHAGFSLASADKPFWAIKANSLQGTTRLLAVVLSVPAGWMIFALLVPVAVYGAKVGWSLARDGVADKRDKAFGWCIVAASVLGCVASAVMIARVT